LVAFHRNVSLCCRYVQHIEKVMQHKDLEAQLLEAKLSQATLQLAEEKERNVQEKQQVRK